MCNSLDGLADYPRSVRTPRCHRAQSFSHIHGLVEATKSAFIIRNTHIADPATATRDIREFLEMKELDRLAAKIDMERALPWPHVAAPGDTIWLGVIDGQGRGVSYIQSLFHEFGSGVALPQTGVLWQNRGASFRLEEGAHNRLASLLH